MGIQSHQHTSDTVTNPISVPLQRQINININKQCIITKNTYNMHEQTLTLSPSNETIAHALTRNLHSKPLSLSLTLCDSIATLTHLLSPSVGIARSVQSVSDSKHRDKRTINKPPIETNMTIAMKRQQSNKNNTTNGQNVIQFKTRQGTTRHQHIYIHIENRMVPQRV